MVHGVDYSCLMVEINEEAIVEEEEEMRSQR
jgi:hypothetical protein